MTGYGIQCSMISARYQTLTRKNVKRRLKILYLCAAVASQNNKFQVSKFYMNLLTILDFHPSD